jgi:hypothetical protein
LSAFVRTAFEGSEEPHPEVFAVPGNHDWYDNLVSFTRLFCIFPGLEKQRNELMHRPPPTKLDTEQTALALLVLLYLIRHRTGTRTNDLFDQHPPIEQDVIDELGLKKQDLWFTLAEELVLEDYGEQHLPGYRLILLVLCWPLALLALVLYPLVWLLLLPFRLIGSTVEGVRALGVR